MASHSKRSGAVLRVPVLAVSAFALCVAAPLVRAQQADVARNERTPDAKAAELTLSYNQLTEKDGTNKAGANSSGAVPIKNIDSPSEASRNFTLAELNQEETTKESTETTTMESGASQPFSFSIEYSLWSDYVWRGINLSEFSTEGREKPNHQLNTDMSVDLAALFGQESGSWGTLGFATFFEWFAAQKVLDPVHGGQNLQEVDYNIYWSYEIEPLATTFTTGFLFYRFPNNSTIDTQEWWIQLDHNDAWMWTWLFPENEDGVLNPSFYLGQDVGITGGGMWFELGFSHDFEVFENFTLTPNYAITADHRYYDKILGTPGHTTASTRLAYQQIGLTASYDLSSALKLPDWLGGLTISGFLYFDDALGNLEDNYKIQDEFFGGTAISWSFGG